MALIAKRLREIDFPHETFRVPDGGTSWTQTPTRCEGYRRTTSSVASDTNALAVA